MVSHERGVRGCPSTVDDDKEDGKDGEGSRTPVGRRDVNRHSSRKPEGREREKRNDDDEDAGDVLVGD